MNYYLRPSGEQIMEFDGDIEGEVTRLEAVKYLQGALGHAVGSTLFLVLGGLLWVGEYEIFSVVSIAVAFLVSANGLSIWAWDRLRSYFWARSEVPENPESTRELTARPFALESRVEIQAGVVMILVFVALLLLARFSLQFLDPRTFGYVFVGVLSVGNITALAIALRTSAPATPGKDDL
jgi:uncharacterized membrane protein (DUF485 family)